MKKIIGITLISFAALTVQAQSIMVKYFNMIPTEKRQDMKVIEKNGKFSTNSETPTRVVVDDKNGFLEVIDNGTGGGNITYQVAMFKDLAGKVTLAFSMHTFDGVMHESDIAFYDPANKMTDVGSRVYGTKISNTDFQKTVYKGKAKLSDFVNGDHNNTKYTYYVLPRQGLDIKVYHGYAALDNACQIDKIKEACDFLTQYHPFVLLKWNKTKGIFEK